MISRSHSNLFNSRRNRLVLSLSRLCSLSSFSLFISLNLYLSPPPSGSLPRLSTYTGYGESAQRVKFSKTQPEGTRGYVRLEGYTEYFVDVTYPWVRIEP